MGVADSVERGGYRANTFHGLLDVIRDFIRANEYIRARVSWWPSPHVTITEPASYGCCPAGLQNNKEGVSKPS